MNRDTLKLIHYLPNFEISKTKLLQIVLVGQEELRAKIMQYRELASRMFPIVMNSMSPEELKDMIDFRLKVAGYKDELFPAGEVPFPTPKKPQAQPNQNKAKMYTKPQNRLTTKGSSR